MVYDNLLAYGVPAEWLHDVKTATADGLLALTDHLPAEAAEAVLELAIGGNPRVPKPLDPVLWSIYEHVRSELRARALVTTACFRRSYLRQSPGDLPRLNACIIMLYAIGTAGFEPATP